MRRLLGVLREDAGGGTDRRAAARARPAQRTDRRGAGPGRREHPTHRPRPRGAARPRRRARGVPHRPGGPDQRPPPCTRSGRRRRARLRPTRRCGSGSATTGRARPDDTVDRPRAPGHAGASGDGRRRSPDRLRLGRRVPRRGRPCRCRGWTHERGVRRYASSWSTTRRSYGPGSGPAGNAARLHGRRDGGRRRRGGPRLPGAQPGRRTHGRAHAGDGRHRGHQPDRGRSGRRPARAS